MNTKKFAIRGLVILAVVVALCMFFSGTIRTIATAKVRITRAQQGKMRQQISLSGELTFLEEEEVFVDAGGQSLQVTKVNVLPGYQVAAGDVIFEAEIADYEKTMSDKRAEYESSYMELMDLEQANGSTRLSRTDTLWAEAYYALSDATQAALEKQIAMETLLAYENLDLDENGAVPETASDELKQAVADWNAAKASQAEAEEAMQQASRYSVPEATRTYITQRKELNDKLAQLESDMLALSVAQKELGAVRAPVDGYIVSVDVKKGESFDPSGAAYSYCPLETLPVLRADISDIEVNISSGMAATFSTSRGRELESEVASTGVTVDGNRYADIALDEELIDDMGGAYSLLQNATNITIEYRAQTNTSLIASSAVRGSGDERYVYIIRQQQSTFGAMSMVTEKLAVTVLAEIDGVCSIAEDISYYDIAYMEDRPISENMTVMQYTN